MKVIISPTKQMRDNQLFFFPESQPELIKETATILDTLKKLNLDEAQRLWKCSDKLALENYERLKQMNVNQGTSPAIMSYKGLQYQYMAPDILTTLALEYIQNHVRILSGLYGVLRPFDGIVPYRLEMQAALSVNGAAHLYEFWGQKLYTALTFSQGPIINLASKEYANAITPYLKKTDTWIDIVFAQKIEGKLKVKATLAKMARGEMVRYLAENQIETLDGIKGFDHPDYAYSEEHSTATSYVFLYQERSKESY